MIVHPPKDHSWNCTTREALLALVPAEEESTDEEQIKSKRRFLSNVIENAAELEQYDLVFEATRRGIEVEHSALVRHVTMGHGEQEDSEAVLDLYAHILTRPQMHDAIQTKQGIEMVETLKKANRYIALLAKKEEEPLPRSLLLQKEEFMYTSPMTTKIDSDIFEKSAIMAGRENKPVLEYVKPEAIKGKRI